MASTRSQRSTRSSKTNPSQTPAEAAMAMEVDDVVRGLQQLSNPTDFSKCIGTKNENPPSNIQMQNIPVPIPIEPLPNTSISSSTNFHHTVSNLLDAASSSAMETDQPAESGTDSSSSDSSDSSDSEDTSETDEETAAKNKIEDQEDLHTLEKMFTYAREVLYHERTSGIDRKLDEVRCGRSTEYLGPLQELQETMSVKVEITAQRRDFKLTSLRHQVESEELASLQNFESEKSLLYDRIKSDLEDKIRRLEEDRNNDFSSDFFFEAALKKKNKKSSVDIFGEKKKKPCVVTGPYVVYMLNDVDIMEDWTIIKKALAAPKRKYIDPFVF